MKPDLRKIASRQCAQAITVGVLMDQVRLMREAWGVPGSRRNRLSRSKSTASP